MGFLDTPWFNKRKYEKRCRKAETCSILVDKHHRKVRAMSAAAVTGTAGVAFAYMTSGISLVGTAYSIRQFHILYQQSKIIEESLIERKHFPMPELRVKDVIIGMLMGAGAYAAGFGVGIGLEHLVHPIMDSLSTASATVFQTQLAQTATQLHSAGLSHTFNSTTIEGQLYHVAVDVIQHVNTTMHHVAYEASAVLHNPEDAIRGVGDGVCEAFGGHQVPIPVGASAATATLAKITGQTIGISTTHTAGDLAASRFVSVTAEHLARKEKGRKNEKKEKRAKKLKKTQDDEKAPLCRCHDHKA